MSALSTRLVFVAILVQNDIVVYNAAGECGFLRAAFSDMMPWRGKILFLSESFHMFKNQSKH